MKTVKAVTIQWFKNAVKIEPVTSQEALLRHEPEINIIDVTFEVPGLQRWFTRVYDIDQIYSPNGEKVIL